MPINFFLQSKSKGWKYSNFKIPFIYEEKNFNFKLGVLIENIHSLFYDRTIYYSDYLYNDLVLDLFIKWEIFRLSFLFLF